MWRFVQRERAQALPIFALLIVVFLGMVGLAIDAGRLYVARAELTRALDSAALAGVIELPDLDEAEGAANTYMTDNEPGAEVEFPTQVQNQFRVRGRLNVELFFMSVLGFNSMEVEAEAAAGFGIVPSDTVMLVDATGSMGASPCNGSGTNSGCPIKEARDAANQFKDLFLGSGTATTQLGFTPFRGCHNPPRTYSGCITNSMRVDLTSSESAVTTAISNTTALGGSGTNVCLALYKAQEMFNGANAQSAPNTVKSIVILSDGNNTYNAGNAYSSGQNHPPSACRPSSSPGTSDNDVSVACNSASNRARSRDHLDPKTKTIAQTLRDDDVEIYVVAFGVCGTINSTVKSTNYCNGIGNGDHDNTADQRLLKCIASSTAGTNDHFFAVPTAEDLPEIFEDVARAIAFRLIE